MKKLSKKLSGAERRHIRRKKRISYSVRGTAERPRLVIYRSNSGLYAQVINDDKGVTLLSLASNSKETKGKVKNTKEGAQALGDALAKKALAASISAVVFDRAGYLYHGKVKAFAEGARAGGLKF